MKSLFNIIPLFLAAGIVLIHGCTTVEADPFGGCATIELDRFGSSDYTSVSVRLVPSPETVSYRYAIGEISEKDAFINGEMSGIVTVDGNMESIYTFTELIPNKTYSVFAVAADSNGIEGPVAIIKISTEDDGFFVEKQYLTDETAGFIFTLSDDYRGGRYYLGQMDDLEDFTNAEVGSEFYETSEWVANYYELSPSSEHVFFYQSISRTGKLSDVKYIEFTTNSEADCPKVTLSYTNNIYKGEYVLTPNDKCGKITSFVCRLGENDDAIYSWGGNISAMIDTWEEMDIDIDVESSYGGTPCTITFFTEELLCDNPLEIYVKVYDRDGTFAGLQHFEMSTPLFNENAGPAEMTVEVYDITLNGATYKYRKGNNTFAFMYDSVYADWYDDFKNNDPEWSEFYLHNYLFSSGKYWSYGKDVTIFKETAAEPGTRLYAVGCPMNENGPQGGWGELVLAEYTTLSE